MFWLCPKIGIMRAKSLKFKKAAILKYFLYVLHSFISYNPGWNEPKLISPKMQVNFFPNQNYLSKKRKKI